ncbi:MAG: branched-chain amino acid transport system substrate-binding protein [Gaiellaceae bacterium]|jgi:branched-chain amino acid transport system substrate-binding protein|nr:branched-chain amino acid transport system substrate-binding protein [Gaiellaceae bacterium]
MTGRWTRGVLSLGAIALIAAALAATAAARVDAPGGAVASQTVNVGFLYPKTGGLAAFGQEEYDGFQAGLAYTKGKCGGYTINPTYIDDATDPATAITAFKNLVGQGIKIIGGTGSSGIALQLGPLAAQNNVLYIAGAAANDGITGLNRNTFRAGRQTLQDVLDAANIFPPKATGKKLVVFAEDTAFGQGNYAAVNLIFGSKGHTVSKILSPFGAADLTPFAQQLKNSGADAAFVAWANTTNSAAMWQALQQQGVAKQMTIVTGLANRESYDSIGPLVQGVTLLSHYVYQAPHNAVNTYLVKYMAKQHSVPNIFTPDGFVTAQMICRALQKGGTDTAKQIGALEGWQFLAPKGKQFIRTADHAMLQPMFQVQLLPKAGGHFGVKVLKTISAGNVQPPVTPFK